MTALGLNIYNKENKLLPCTTFQWSEIRHISFDDKKFIIKPVEPKAPNVIFYSQKLKVNKLILDLCVGNHGTLATFLQNMLNYKPLFRPLHETKKTRYYGDSANEATSKRRETETTN